MRILSRIALVISLTAGGQTGFAQSLTSQDGRLLASNCFQCHGTNGSPTSGGFDKLAGESASEIFEELKEMQRDFKAVASGKNNGGDSDEAIMQVHATAYTDAEIRALASFFAAQKKKSK